jgi:hypothetical protein
MFVNDRMVRESQAKRNPEDKFSMKTGVELALNRLWTKKAEKKPKKAADATKRFAIGENVVVFYPVAAMPEAIGQKGIVIAIDERGVGVEFETKFSPQQHDCDGAGRKDRCLWMHHFLLKKAAPLYRNGNRLVTCGDVVEINVNGCSAYGLYREGDVLRVIVSHGTGVWQAFNMTTGKMVNEFISAAEYDRKE